MRSCRQNITALVLGLLVQASTGIDRKSHVRSRELQVNSVQASGGACRCEYPGEHLYDGDDANSDTLQTVGETKVFPSSHSACADLWFICPNVEFLGGTPWTQECPSDEEGGVRRRTLSAVPSQSRMLTHREEPDKYSFYKNENANGNGFPEEFHHLVDDSNKEFYTVLPADNDFCANGGTRIRSGEIPLGDCASKILSFSKAGDRRTLPAGTSVANEWFPNLGVKITASSDGGPDNMHPMVFDMANPHSNGVSSENASMLGGHVELGNVLVPLRGAGVVGSADDYGILNFEFHEQTFVNYITLLNVDNFSKIFVTQASGAVSIYGMDSAGLGGVQTVELGLENVIRLSVSFKTFAAIVSMDLCIIRIHD